MKNPYATTVPKYGEESFVHKLLDGPMLWLLEDFLYVAPRTLGGAVTDMIPFIKDMHKAVNYGFSTNCSSNAELFGSTALCFVIAGDLTKEERIDDMGLIKYKKIEDKVKSKRK